MPPPTQFHVLVALTHGDRHSDTIMQDVEDSSGGVVKMGLRSLTALYPINFWRVRKDGGISGPL